MRSPYTFITSDVSKVLNFNAYFS